MWDKLTRICRVCFTSQIGTRYIVYVIVVFMVLTLLLEKSHLDAIKRLQNIRVSSSKVDNELEEQLRQFYQSNVNATVRNVHNNVKDAERFTIILQTYNRTDILMKLLNHYCAVPRLDKIIVVWNNIDEQPPLEVWIKYAPHPVPVLFLRQDENKMRNRLKPFKQIETKGLHNSHTDHMFCIGIGYREGQGDHGRSRFLILRLFCKAPI